MKKPAPSSLLTGIHSVDAALNRAPDRLKTVTVAQECRNPRVRKLEERARGLGVPVRTESRAVLDLRSDGQRHQDVIAEFDPANTWGEKDLDRLLAAYETKYPAEIADWRDKMRSGYADGTRTLVRYTPASGV